jgi:hypothetical protein
MHSIPFHDQPFAAALFKPVAITACDDPVGGLAAGRNGGAVEMAGLDPVIGDKIGFGRGTLTVCGQSDMDVGDAVVRGRDRAQNRTGKANEFIR